MSTGMDPSLAHFEIVADGVEEQLSQPQVAGLGEVQAVDADVARHIDDERGIGIDKDGAFASRRCTDAIVERDDLRRRNTLRAGGRRRRQRRRETPARRGPRISLAMRSMARSTRR